MDILKKIETFEFQTKPKLDKMYRYYKANQDILQTQKDKNKPNNKIANNYAKNIVNNTIGYYMSNSVKYITEDENLANEIELICNYNDDDFHNTSIAKDLSVYGIAYELMYLDVNKEIRYKKISATNTFVEYDNTLEENILYAIRYYDITDDDNQVTRYIEIYDDEFITYYTYKNSLMFVDKVQHFFNDNPINVYYNNEEKMGDFENIISLIDAYDKLQSESLNDFDVFADAYLALTNMNSTDSDDIAKLREDRVLLLGDGGAANWLTKDVNDTHIENLKNRLDKDIYKFSNTVNMSDENFANNSSGVAIKYKLMNFENRVSATERYFVKALQRRVELICNILNLKGSSYDFSSVSFAFSRNIPNDLNAISDVIIKLKGMVSIETLIAQLPFIEDVQAEMKRLDVENQKAFEENIAIFGQNQTTQE